ncbi:PREDICTED: zinc finger CCCH domain-containing protein 55-like isoform X3 [Camelina sativa]|uniref:Zinc finger CCCH domain-containing protein 55-like isoform X3 n=1 Tax=Camelina sativa TaxID=90675 RepID=A0ABM0W6D4_CAMSA|nr:PREDICTED: zinc finger CCCH domain-containing protein 55-like isoform X3 [Camelina sativa]
MDPGDPTSILFTKIRTLEPDFASKIIGYLLLQDLGNRDLMRLALGPDTFLQSVCLKAKSALGLSSSSNGSSSSSASSPLNPISRPINIHRHSLSQSSSGNGFMEFSRNPLSPSYTTPGSLGSNPNMISSPFQASSSLFASDGVGAVAAAAAGDSTGNGDLLDEHQLGNYLSFLNESSSKNKDESVDPFGFSSDNGGDAHLHKRSFSASDACFGSEEPGFGGGGYNRFQHGGLGDDFDSSPGGFGSPDYVTRQQEEMMRMKMAQRQRMAAAQYLAASGSPMSYEKGLSLLLHQRNAHRSGAGQFGEEGYWYGSPGRHERDEFMGMGDKSNSASKQIYLTFPADSSFTDEDVSNYFGNFGPVQDVRIPYQQKRMFGFVTFVHSETVRIILARGNPHFICDSRVLVKPYKEKGRILENRRQQQQMLQQMERGNYSPGSSPSGMDSRDLFDCHLAPRMFSNTQEMMRRKAEQAADLQQAIEYQRKRFLNLQLPDMDSESFLHHQRGLVIGSPVHFAPRGNQSLLFRSENTSDDVIEGHFQSEANRAFLSNTDHNISQERGYNNHLNNGQETSLENALPDSFFASPSKTSESHDPEFEKENCATLSVTTENKAASSLQSA